MGIPNEYIEETEEQTGPGYRVLQTGDDFVTTTKRGWVVRTTNPYIDPLTVRYFAELPVEGATYVSYGATAWNPYLLVKTVNVEPHGDNPQEWLYTAEYSTAVRRPDQQADVHNPTQPNPGSPTPATNPELRLPTIQWSGRYERRPFEIDREGKPILNSAGDRFDPQPEEEFRIQTVTYERYETSFDQERAARFSEPTLNETEIKLIKFGKPEGDVQIVKPRCAKMTRIDGNTYLPVTGAGLVAKVVYQMEIAEEKSIKGLSYSPWDLLLWDLGRREIGADGKLTDIIVKGKSAVTDQPLDGKGKALVPPADLPPQAGSEPHPVREWIRNNQAILKFVKYPDRDFHELNLTGLIVPVEGGVIP